MNRNIIKALSIGSLILGFTTASNAQSKLISFWDFNLTRPLGGGSTDSLGTRFSYSNPFVTFQGSTDSTNKTYPLFPSYSTNAPATAKVVVGAHPGTTFLENASGGSHYYDYSSDHNYFYNSIPYFSSSDSTGSAAQCYLKLINPVQKDTVYMYLPTTGYQNIHLDFALSASSATHAPNYSIFSYSTNGGTTWNNLTRQMDTFNISGVYMPDTLQLINPTTGASGWYPVQMDFSSDASVNNNANFILRWVYAGTNVAGGSGNSRYDNFALTGDSVCPVFIVQPTGVTTCATGNTYFVVHTAGGTSVGYQWQVNTGSGYTNVNNTGVYTGATTDSLVISNTSGLNGYLYECVVTSTCSSITSNPVTLTVDPALSVSISSSTNVTCFGNGSATAAPTGGTSAYTYLWTGGQTNATATNLSAGTYTVTLSDADGCSASTTATIAQNGVAVNIISVVNIECVASGSATAVASNGTMPYTYSWTGGQTNAMATNLTAGTYTITVTDNTGCTGSNTAVIAQFIPIRDSIIGYGHYRVIHYWDFNNTTPSSGLGGDSLGNASNPLTAPYTALSTPGYIAFSRPLAIQNTPLACTRKDSLLDNLTPGAYVNDLPILGNDSASSGAGNLAIRSRNPNENAYMYVYAPTTGYQNIVMNYAISASSSHGAYYNVFSYSVDGGTTWKNLTTAMDTFNIGGVYRPDTLQVINPITILSQWYPVKIDFSSDASVSNNANFVLRWQFEGPGSNGTSGNDRYDNISISGNSILETCNGGNDYTAFAGVKYGETPYTYTWTPNVSSSDTASNISAGTYTVNVTDASGCSASSTITVSQPALLSAGISSHSDVTCYGSDDGSASGTGSSGTPPYTYTWTGGSTNTSVSALSAGTYTITVQDLCGASATASVNISQPSGMIIAHDSTADNGSGNGLAAVSVTAGGVTPFTYLWSPGSQTTDTIKDQNAGTYCCTITDNNGCSQSTCVTIKSATGIKNISNSSTISIYPDPNNGLFTIDGLQKGMLIEIYDYTGRVVSNATADDNSMQFKLSGQPNGIYLIRILLQNGTLVSEKKMVKTE